MKHRKRLIGLCCTTLLLFSLTACDLVGQEKPVPQTAPVQNEQTEETPSPVPAEETPEESNAATVETGENSEPAEETETLPGEEEQETQTAGTAEQPTEETPANEPENGSEEPAQTEEPTETEQPQEQEPAQQEPSGGEAESQPTEEPAEETVTAPSSAGVEAFELSGPALLAETADQGQSYIDSMIFLGDSTTYGMKYYAVLSGGKNTQQVWTPSNGTLTLSYQGFASIVYPPDGSEITIRDAVSKALPEYMVITLGVNGISFMDEDYFKSEYISLVTDIQSLSPNTKIILNSIYPVASNYEYLSSINNEKISTANRWVMEIAEECNVRFLNTASVLVGEDGWLPQNLQNGDGLHLNETGFGIVLSYIRTHGYQ